VDGTQPLGELVYRVLGDYRAQFESHRELAFAGTDPEAIHQMRVSARRIRSCLRAFRGILAPAVLDLDLELRWIATALGEVRDVDVLIQRNPRLAAPFAELRSSRLTQLQKDLDSERFANLELALRGRIDLGARCHPELDSIPISAAAADIVDAAYRHVRKRTSRIDPKDPVTLHELRKAAKRLRYTVDCFAGFYGKPLHRFVDRLKAVQEVLGDYQDAIVAEGLLEEMRGHDSDNLLKQYKQEARIRAENQIARLPGYIDDLDRAWSTLEKRMEREQRRLWR